MTTDERLDQIEKIASNARTTWFGLLALLVFVGVTLMGHRDVDFFLTGAETELPIVGFSVPPIAFFIAAPLLTAAIYIYFHMYLQALWEALADVPARYGTYPRTVPISEKIYPTLLTRAALLRRARTRPGEAHAPCIERQALSFGTEVVAFWMTWMLGPLVLALVWIRSWPLHHEGLSFFLLSPILIAALVFGHNSYGVYVRRLRGESRAAVAERQAKGRGWWKLLIVVLTVPTIAWVRTTGGPSEWPPLKRLLALDQVQWALGRPDYAPVRTLISSARLAEAELTPRPADWKPFAHSLRDHREQRGGDTDQDSLIPTDDEIARYRNWIEGFDSPQLRGRAMEHANLWDAFLPGADLRETNLRNALLGGARMQGADLWFAQMQAAVLWQAQMQGADLRDAQMQGAVLRDAEMQGAVLWGAQMQGADLRDAQMQGADLTGAAFLAALAHSADIRCRNGTLDQSQLSLTVGDRRTVLPDGLWVWSCLDRTHPDVADRMTEIEAAIAHHPEEGTFFGISRAQFEERLWCDDGEHAFQIDYDPFERRFWKDSMGSISR